MWAGNTFWGARSLALSTIHGLRWGDQASQQAVIGQSLWNIRHSHFMWLELDSHPRDSTNWSRGGFLWPQNTSNGQHKTWCCWWKSTKWFCNSRIVDWRANMGGWGSSMCCWWNKQLLGWSGQQWKLVATLCEGLGSNMWGTRVHSASEVENVRENLMDAYVTQQRQG